MSTWAKRLTFLLVLVISGTLLTVLGAFPVLFPTAMVLLLTCSWLIARLRPTYYRIVPGRLDIMRGRAFGTGVEVISRMDLQQLRIELNPKEEAILFGPRGGNIEKLSYRDVSEPMRFIEAVFKAAICTSPAPPLPDDALLG